MNYTRSIAAIAAALALSAGSAQAQNILFSSTGAFNGGGCNVLSGDLTSRSCQINSGENGQSITLKYTFGEVQTLNNFGNANFGFFTTTGMGPATFDDVLFTLTVKQTSPSVGTESLDWRMRISHLTPLALLFALAACGEREANSNQPAAGSSDSPAALISPDPAALAAAAPDSFTLLFTTSKGDVELRVRREWSPLGVDRLHYLASNGFFDGARFFRVVPGFVVQFGLSGRPAVDEAFKRLMINDDSVRVTNRRGTLVFATSGPDTRTSQLFINLADNGGLDEQGFSPMGEVVRGMDVVEQINAEYGEQSNIQGRIEREGNDFFRERFPALDSIVSVRIVP